MDYSPKKITADIKKHNFSFKKKFGQNFIADENIINNIILKSQIDKNTLVIEIGPGAGSLTYKLALSSKNVLCYEIDTTLKDLLQENLSGANNVEVVFQDFLKSNVKKDIEKYKYDKLYVVANLPYYITTPIIMKFIDEDIKVDKLVIMVQKEVGDRFKATPNSKEYNSLSVYLNYFFDIKKILDVSRNVFIPKPNVDSIVLEFNRREKNSNLKNERLFFNIVRDAFRQKRKTLRNNLIGYDLVKLEEVLQKHGFDLNTRAEQLPIEVFIDIANNL